MDAESIVREYSSMIYKIAYHYAGNSTDADDIYSEVFLTYFKKERSFESEEHRKAWLIRVTINCAKEFLSGKNYTEELNEEIAGAAPDSTSKEELMDLRQAIQKLKPAQRDVVELYYLQELPIKEVAEILDMNENTVKVTLMRAREQLRTLLGD